MKHLTLTLAMLLQFCSMGHAATHCNGNGGGTQAGCTDSAEVNLSGTVEAFCELEVVVDQAASQLNIREGETNKKVATVREISNNVNGYDVSLSSMNGGFLRNGLTASESDIAYTVAYGGGTELQLQATATVVASVEGSGGSTQTERDLTVSLPAQPNAGAGTWTDIVIINIAAR